MASVWLKNFSRKGSPIPPAAPGRNQVTKSKEPFNYNYMALPNQEDTTHGKTDNVGRKASSQGMTVSEMSNHSSIMN